MNSKVYIGFDPGISGALGVLDKYGDFVDVKDFPKSILNIKRINVFLLAAQIEHYIENFEANIIVEQVHAMPRDGGVSAFTFGMNFGMLLAAIEMHTDEYVFITPQKWKKYFGLTKEKKESVELALKLFPSIKDKLYGARGGLKDGRAEALLIARYLYETNNKR